MKRKYKISKKLLLNYYNILGIDVNKLDASQLETENGTLEDFTPSEIYYLPESSRILNQYLLDIIYKMCNEFSEDNRELQAQYYEAISGILNTTTSLNLLEPDSTDEHLLFERLNVIILLTLKSFQSFDVTHVIALWEHIFNSDYNAALQYINTDFYVGSFLYLAMNPNSDIEDYKMFKPGTSLIDINTLKKLVLSNIHKNDEFKGSSIPFIRCPHPNSQKI